jgi:hypothetical protein
MEAYMSTIIPIWIIGAPFLALLALSYMFKGQSAMGGTLPREEWLARSHAVDRSAPLLDPVAPNAPRRSV